MPSLSDLRVDLTGWNPENVTESKAHWSNAAGDLLSLTILPPDPPGILEDLTALRNATRHNMRQTGSGLVEFDIVPLAGLPGIRAIFKVPQQPTGMTYVASLNLSLTECTYVLKVMCPERGTTGIRDSVVLAQLMAEVKPSTQAEFQRWFEEQWAQDPYDPTDHSPVRRNRSEDPRYDAQFPAHPLSRARRYLAHLARTLQVSPALLQARPSTPPKAEPQNASQLLSEPRRLHYEFAHRTLPYLFLKDPDKFLGALHQGNKAFLEHLWMFVAKDMPPQELVAPDGLDVGFQVYDDSVVAVVRLPPARAAAEALLVGCYFWTKPPPGQAARVPARYFTLELGFRQDESLRTVLGEWGASWDRFNYGDGPKPDPAAFIAAIRDLAQSS